MADLTVSANVDTMMGSADNAAIRSNIGLGTSDSPQFTAIEVGAATDTTLARASAGNLSIEGNLIYRAGGTDVPVADGGTGASTLTGIVIGNGTSPFTTVTAPSGTVVGTSDSQTLTNKRITLRTVTEADATSWTPAGDTSDISYQLNTQATGTLTVNAPSGTPTNGQRLILKLKATNVQTFSWNAIYRGGTDIALPTVSTAAKTDYVSFFYNTVDTKWDLVGVARGF